MKNLAGDPKCDDDIKRELARCGIEVVRGERSTHEVAASITGKLGAFTFRRAWYYWAVEGPMPLDLAVKLYEHPVGRDDIRTAGYSGNIDPREYGTDYYDADGNQLSSDPTGKEAEAAMGFVQRGTLDAKAFDGHRFVPDKRVGYASAFVRCYHVDSELGLYVLAHAIRCLAVTSPTPRVTRSVGIDGPQSSRYIGRDSSDRQPGRDPVGSRPSPEGWEP